MIKAFYYGIELFEGLILTEELYESGLGKKEDQLLFERITDKGSKKTKITFSESFEKEEKNKMLKDLLIAEFVKPDKPILKMLARREHDYFKPLKDVFNWFHDTLIIISTDWKPRGLPHYIDTNKDFYKYVQKLVPTLDTGISSLRVEKTKHR